MRSLILAHRDKLIEQAVEKVSLVLADDTEIGVVKAERDEIDALIVVASVQTLARPSRLARLRPDFAIVVTDEAHAGDIIDSEAGELLLAANAPQQIAAAYREYAADRQGLAFTPTVKMAYVLAESLKGEGIPAVGLDGSTPVAERRQILRDLRSGAVRVVTNCAVLTEGFDEPAVSCVAVARPTKSRPLFQQMIGRGTRPYPGKTDCLVLDLVGCAARHDLVTTASLFGLPASALATKSVAEAVMARQAATDVPTPVDGRMVSAEVDLFRGRRARWVPTETGRFVLPTGQGTLVLRPGEAGHWDVLHVPSQGPREILMTAMPLSYATGFAEDRVRGMDGQTLIDRHAPWRTAPPSEKQLNLLQRLGVPLAGLRTRGEASDAITAALAAEVA
ncbi:MAG: DEAD/DEAH box helicase [Geminicoccaceae bacterium]